MSDNVDSIVRFSSSVNDQTEPPPLPKGRYKATIRQATVKTSVAKGTKYGELLFHIGPDQYPIDYTEGNKDGTTIAFRRLSLEDNAQSRWRLKQFCETIGAKAPTHDLNVTDWVPLSATVVVDHETYEGVTRAVIVRVERA